MVGKFREHKIVSHSGAVYGCSSTLIVMPEEKLAVVVLGNEDLANARIQKIALAALGGLVDAKRDAPPNSAPRSAAAHRGR